MQKGIIETNAYIRAAASVVGKKEFEGPLGGCFDFHSEDDRFGAATWEAAEAEMQRIALSHALKKANMTDKDLGVMFAGDLLNQCVSSANGLLPYDVPFFGLFGACSTIVEGLILASVMVSKDIFKTAAAVTASHNATAERQFRTPIEYGGQRPPTGQWTVTGSGAFILESESNRTSRENIAVITRCMPGIVVEMGIKDANNMGAAMAPAALSTLTRFFDESGSSPSDYDLIATGDLGYEGGSILRELSELSGYPLSDAVYGDCGIMMFSRSLQDTHCGGSGCACSATVFASYILPQILRGDIKKMLLLGTGALMNPDTIKQGDPISGIAHLIEIEYSGE